MTQCEYKFCSFILPHEINSCPKLSENLKLSKKKHHQPNGHPGRAFSSSFGLCRISALAMYWMLYAGPTTQ